ncbi:hypothetical protein FRC03_011266 [Tulasnella sp. 419]|nr:hypothetical protein FRC02_010480 [Tulasnella sp. 418]KAG8966852.1 hypothetical protein FRC03_011266 [Tulasnella sp. 419]
MVMAPDERFGNRLRSLLPLSRHATFNVRLTIHEVTNIPLINGQFAVRWKFRNVVSSVSRASTPHSANTFKTNGSAEASSTAPVSEFGALETPRLTAEEKGKAKASGSDEDDAESSTPMQSAAATNGSSSYGKFLTPAPVSPTRPSTKPTSTPSISSSSSLQTPTLADTRSDGKGVTSYVQLRDHAVRWEHTTEVVVELKIKRETGDLLPSELKLIVHELPLQGIDNAQPHSRFGVLYLNLAEYADAGPVTRRYLLRESKTNATLKLTIESVWVHGDRDYTVPPLQKGQAVSGVAGVLSRSYMDISSPRFLSPNLVPGGPSSRASTPRNGISTSSPRHNSFRRDSNSSLSSSHRILADPGSHTAEWVIENIFNPWPSSSKTPSPFTIYSPNAPPSKPPSVRSLDATLSTESDAHATVETHTTSESKLDCGASEPNGRNGTTPQDSENVVKLAASISRPPTPTGGGGGVGGWWRRLGGGSNNPSKSSSRPSTPPTTQPPQYRKRKSSGDQSIAASTRTSMSSGGPRRSTSIKSNRWSTKNGTLPIVSVDDYGGP